MPWDETWSHAQGTCRTCSLGQINSSRPECFIQPRSPPSAEASLLVTLKWMGKRCHTLLPGRGKELEKGLVNHGTSWSKILCVRMIHFVLSWFTCWTWDKYGINHGLSQDEIEGVTLWGDNRSDSACAITKKPQCWQMFEIRVRYG